MIDVASKIGLTGHADGDIIADIVRCICCATIVT